MLSLGQAERKFLIHKSAISIIKNAITWKILEITYSIFHEFSQVPISVQQSGPQMPPERRSHDLL